MARMIPALLDAELELVKSRGEAKIYKHLQNKLDDSYLVLFEPRWILKNETSQARDGETDFIIAHPDYGYFCLEVKGGGIHFDGDNWFSIDSSQTRNEIKNPAKQSMEAKYAVKAKLFESHRVTRDFTKAAVGHAVFFPDTENAKQFERPDLPLEIIGTHSNIENLKSWIDGVLKFWFGKDSVPLRPVGINQIIEVLAKPIAAEISLGSKIANLEQVRIRLTSNQIRILDFLESRRRVAISGGAGTGKTVLAIEKAKRLANDGFKTLLTCYNRELGNHIAAQLKDHPNLVVANFDRLTDHFVTIADEKLKKDVLSQAKATYPNSDLWRVQMPTAMTYALEYINERYDAIVVDEAQDFADEYWFPLEYLLTDPIQGPFYIFFDTHQNLYKRSLNFPVIEAPFELNINCRNTREIHDFAYKNYVGPRVKPADLHGNNVAIIKEENDIDQAKIIHKTLVEMIARKGIKPEQIVILVGDSLTKKEKYGYIRELQLPFGNKWSIENGIKNSHVLIDTVKRFKGLESEIVLIWGLPSEFSGELTEVLYVGSSRAKSELIIIGNENELASAFILNKS